METRIVIYVKDVQRITGKSPRASRAILTQVRKTLGKKSTQLITIGEFCSYMKFSRAEIESFVR